MENNRNLILAIVLSLVVLLGWQVFIAGPQMDQAQKQQAAEQAAKPASGTAPGAPATTLGSPVDAVAAAPTLTREAALAQAPRVKIDSRSLSGSINLIGGRMDDLRLKDYRETVDANSPTVVLLSPVGAPDAYFADLAWAGTADAGPLPSPTTKWTAADGAVLSDAAPVTLTYDNGAGLVFTRTIAVDDKYMFTVTDAVRNTGAMAQTLTPVGRVTRVGVPAGNGSWILHLGLIGVTDKLEMVGYNDIKSAKEKTWTGINNGWVGFTDKYFAATLIPDKAQPFTGRFAYTQAAMPQPAPAPLPGAAASPTAPTTTTDVFETDFTNPAVTVAPGESASSTTHMFAGAKQVAVVDGYAQQYGINLFDHLIDWGWLWFFTKPFFYLIDWFFHLFGNFGLAILATTVLAKAAFFPLANKSFKSMAAMRKIQPLLADIKEKYKDDRLKQQQATMELYKKEKVNPLAGCWPVALQIPVFFSLYSVLYVTIEMRQAPFFGWIKDLAAPDPSTVLNLFGMLPFSPAAIPIIGSFAAIGIWPLIMGVTMFVQMRLNPTPTVDPTQQMIFTWMPVLFTFMLAGFPAGLVIYWAWNNTLTIVQQYVIMRRAGAKVDLVGNIMSAFRRPKPATVGAPAAMLTAPANDPGTPAQKQGKKPKQAGAKT